jgi:hypothetical protein
MISKLRKFCQFWIIVGVSAIATVLLLFPHSFADHAFIADSTAPSTIHIPQIQEIVDTTPALAWSETGATVLPWAAQVMALRNPIGINLNPTQKKYLRPLFGNLVDRVTVVYKAQLLDRWSQDGKETHIGGVDSSAQTYCDRIYVRAVDQPTNTDRLVLLAHELTHAQQCQQAGGISQFGERYFNGYYQAGQTYEDNPLEKSARAMEQKFTRQLCNAIGCPPSRGQKYYVNYKGWGIKLPVNL